MLAEYLGEYYNYVSIQWWLENLLKTYEENPLPLMIIGFLSVIILWLLLRKDYDPKKVAPLTKKEQDALIADWEPEPLCPPLTAEEQKNPVKYKLVEGAAGGRVTVNGNSVVNLVSYNFLGLADNPDVKTECRKTIDKYGVGSCGPRGFYGTIDVHLGLEAEISKFLGVEEAIFYADGLACVSSVIPAFAKQGDLIVCDEGVHFGIQQGLHLSKSNVLYFKHNDMEDLKNVLDTEEQKMIGADKAELNRRFIVVEGLYQNHGDICPLADVVQLKHQFKYRLIVDDSCGFGVLGKSGRGTHDHWNVDIEEIDIFCANLDSSVASVGGFCVGSHQVVGHQRLSGSGYVFSASAPPYVCTAAIVNLKEIAANPQLCLDAQTKAARLRAALKDMAGIAIVGEEQSPVLHLRFSPFLGSEEAEKQAFEGVVEEMYEGGFVVEVSRYLFSEKRQPRPSLRIMVSSDHTTTDLDLAAKLLKKLIRQVLQ